MKKISFPSASYVALLAVAIFVNLHEIKYAHPQHNFGQLFILKLLMVMLILIFAAGQTLYLAYWEIVKRSMMIKWLLKVVIFPVALLLATLALNKPGATSIASLLVLFVLLSDFGLYFERFMLGFADRFGEKDRELFFKGENPRDSSQLFALDFFIFSITALLIAPRIFSR